MNKHLRTSSIMIGIVLALGVGCSGAAGNTEGRGQADEAITLRFFNWSEYINPEIYPRFEEETGILVIEDTYASNEEMYAKLEEGSVRYDVIVPTDYMVARLIEENKVAILDHSQLKNLDSLDPKFTNPPFDPGLKHCIPYFWGTTGIGFNWNDWEEAPDSWAYLFDPELAAEFDGQIALLEAMREVFAAAHIYLGHSVNSTDEAEIREAHDLIMGVRDYIAVFDSDTYEDRMLDGEISLVLGWSGDTLTAQVDDENIDYVIPKEGAVIWMDNLCVTPNAAADPVRYAAALKWIDFLTRPEIAAMNTNFVWFASPNADAADDIDEEILNYEAIYPSQETFARLQWMEGVGDATELYESLWAEIISDSD